MLATEKCKKSEFDQLTKIGFMINNIYFKSVSYFKPYMYKRFYIFVSIKVKFTSKIMLAFKAEIKIF